LSKKKTRRTGLTCNSAESPIFTGFDRVNYMTDPNVGSNQLIHRFTVQPVRPVGPSRVSKLFYILLKYSKFLWEIML